MGEEVSKIAAKDELNLWTTPKLTPISKPIDLPTFLGFLCTRNAVLVLIPTTLSKLLKPDKIIFVHIYLGNS